MRVALVLGSGGARGYAHLGVVDELRARGHEIVAISGTSMGALVGALTAAGRDQEFADWARSLTQRKVWQLLDPALTAPGAIRGTKVITRVSGLLGEGSIEDLPIPFTAVASDLTTQREVWFQSGPVTAAIRASIAIPGALTPVEMGGHVLVDGGLLNPVPVEPVLAVPADFVLAVNLTGPDHPSTGSAPVHEAAQMPEGQDSVTWLAKVGMDLDKLRWARGNREPGVQEVAARSGSDRLTTTDVLMRTWETVQAATARYRMATNPPHVVVTVPLRACRGLDFHRAAEMIDLGRSLAAKSLSAAGY
ncbi:MAG: patatin-like phospholipase family protein [Actinomycetales bacterium]